MSARPLLAAPDPISSSARLLIHCEKCRNAAAWNQAAATGWTSGEKVGAFLCPACNGAAEKQGRPYICFYNGRRAELWAGSSYEAQQKAAAILKVPERRRYLIAPMLADIVHTPDF